MKINIAFNLLTVFLILCKLSIEWFDQFSWVLIISPSIISLLLIVTVFLIALSFQRKLNERID